MKPWIWNFHKSNLGLSCCFRHFFCHLSLLCTLHSSGRMSALFLPVFCTEVKWWFWFSPTVRVQKMITNTLLGNIIEFSFYSISIPGLSFLLMELHLLPLLSWIFYLHLQLADPAGTSIWQTCISSMFICIIIVFYSIWTT